MQQAEACTQEYLLTRLQVVYEVIASISSVRTSQRDLFPIQATGRSMHMQMLCKYLLIRLQMVYEVIDSISSV